MCRPGSGSLMGWHTGTRMTRAETPFFEAAQDVVNRCRSIALFSETPVGTTRTFLCQAMHQCHNLVRSWMEGVGMSVTVDRVGNLRGFYPGNTAGAQCFVLGSHLDTVPDAGAFDGVLGVVLAISLVELLEGRRLPFGLEIVGFSEEEGVRFGVPFIGSRGWMGQLDQELLATEDKAGVSIAEAIREFGIGPRPHPPEEYREPAGFLEFHIEQGPVLEALDVPLGLVTAIAGQTRVFLTLRGKANHAGTTPMHLRQDALAGAAAWITAVEKEGRSNNGLVATVGALEVLPGATNVIPGEAKLTLDIRHADDGIRKAKAKRLIEEAELIAAARSLTMEYSIKMDQRAVPMNVGLVQMIERVMASLPLEPHRMVSGAGHDAMIVAEKIPAAMVFLRSPGGVSHHPAESVRVEDVEAALRLGLAFLKELSR